MFKRKKYTYRIALITSLLLISTTLEPTFRTQVYASSSSNSNTYKEAQKAVKKAVRSKTLNDIYVAKNKVESLPNGADKDALLNRINVLANADIEDLIYDASLIIKDLESRYDSNDVNDAKNYIVRAKNVLLSFDDRDEINEYNKLINNLNKRVETVTNEYNKMVYEAKLFTNTACSKKTKSAIIEAQNYINQLEKNSNIRLELQQKLNNIEMNQEVINNMLSGWQLINNQWYYYNNDSKKHVGWLNIDSIWYYLDTNGVMQTGWLYNNNSWYYLKNDGSMAYNTIIDGYEINELGRFLG